MGGLVKRVGSKFEVFRSNKKAKSNIPYGSGDSVSAD